MAFTSDHDFKVPIDELLYIMPDARQKLFLKLINDYKIMVPSLKCICANLCWGDPETRKEEKKIHKLSGFDDTIAVGKNLEELRQKDPDMKALDTDYISGVKEYAKEKDPDYKGLSIDDTIVANLDNGDIVEIPKFDQPCQIDYYLIFSTMSAGREVIFIDLPFIYTKRSIPGYRYCVREGKERDFFVNAIEEMCRIPRPKFDEFIEIMAQLSTNKSSPLYWKKPENSDQLMRNLNDLQLRYVKRYK